MAAKDRDATAVDARRLLGFALFDGVDPVLVDSIAQASEPCRLGDGELLLGRDAVNRYLYVVVDGRLMIHLDLEAYSIAELGPGDTVGEISVFDRLPTSAHVVAIGDCTLLRLHESQVWQLVESSHAFARNLLVLLTGRIRKANAMVDRSIQLQRIHQRNATIDSLTGLYNRRWMDEALPLEMGRARRRGLSLAFLMLDVDHFKRCNDRYGHQAGDAVLRALANTLQLSLRTQDMPVRYGGEEFCVMLPGADMAQAQGVSERLRMAVADMRVKADSLTLEEVSISIGCTVMGPGDDLASLLARADRALYRAKAGGRDQVCVEMPDTPA